MSVHRVVGGNSFPGVKNMTKRNTNELVSKKKSSPGIEEMKEYLELILDKNDKAIAFLCGSYISTFEELRKSLVDSKISREKMQCITLGRLGAVLDIFFAYFGLHEGKNEANNSDMQNQVKRYVC